MTSRVVALDKRPARGSTILIEGRAHVVIALLPPTPGRRPAARVTHNPPCGVCESRLRFDAPRRRWWCPECRQGYGRDAMRELLAEVVADGVRAGRNRRAADRDRRLVASGAPGAAAVLLRAARSAGGPGSRSDVVAELVGAERKAARWALRDAGAGPLSPAVLVRAAKDLQAAAASTPPVAETETHRAIRRAAEWYPDGK